MRLDKEPMDLTPMDMTDDERIALECMQDLGRDAATIGQNELIDQSALGIMSAIERDARITAVRAFIVWMRMRTILRATEKVAEAAE